MAYNFPNSPSNGDTVTISNVTYTYNSTSGAWKTTAAGGASGASVTSSDTAPSSPSAGDLWYDTTTLRLYVYYNDGSSSQWVKANPSGSSGALVQETAPSNPGSGNLWFDPSTLETYVYYNDGDSNQWVQTNPAASSAGTTVYSSIDDLPLSGVETGAQAFVSSTSRLYLWNGTGWYNIALINTTPSISGASSAYTLETDGTATTVTITATDAEGIPITYSIASDTSGNIATVTQGTGANTNVFTITPSTNDANAGTFSLTFRASDGVNIATAISEFTLAFQVQNSNYTTALITSVGANNADNNDFVDSSTNSHTITANGDATQSTFSPYRHGGYSMQFDGTGDWIDSPNNADFDLDGEFTIEFWVYLPGSSHNRTVQRVIAPNSGSYTSAPYISIGNDTGITGGPGVAGVLCVTSAVSNGNPEIHANQTGTAATGTYTQVPLNTWVHVAVSRDSSNVVRLFQAGTLVGKKTISSDFDFTYGGTVGARIGRSGWGAGETFGPGFLKDFRIVKGTCLYDQDSGLTVPTETLTAVTNTKYLLFSTPYLKDASSTHHALTVSGDPKIEPFAPYDYETYSATDNGGSIYFDGTGDYLSIPVANGFEFGTGDFTIEMWFWYTGTIARYPIILGNGISGSGIYSGWAVYTDGNVLKLDRYTGSQTTVTFGSFTAAAGTWHHLAIARSGTTIRGFINGTQVGSDITNSVSYDAHNTDPLNIGYGVDGAGTHQWNGYISDIRLVKGTAVYTSDFTPPTAPLTAITNTSLLLKGTNAGIIDKSQSVKAVTLDGSAKSSTTETKYLTSSMSFASQTDFLKAELPSTLGTGDFTIEWWAYFTNINPGGTNYRAILDMRHSGDTTNLWLQQSGDGSWLYYPNYPTTGFTSSTFSNNTWYHIAIARENGTIRFFVDGGLTGSGSDTFDYDSVYLTLNHYSTSSRRWTGYASDLRVTKGLARYTSNFTAPTAALQG